MILGSNITAGSGDSRIGAFTNLGAVFNILSLVSDAVAGYDMDGNIILANENLADLCGLTRQQLIGLDVRSLLLPQSGMPARHGQWPFPMDGSEALLCCRKPNDGTLVPVAVRAKPLGETDCFVLTVRATETVALPIVVEPKRASIQNLFDAVTAQRDDVAGIPWNAMGNGDAHRNAPRDYASKSSRSEGISYPSGMVPVNLADPSVMHHQLSAELRDAADAEVSALYIAEGDEFKLKNLTSSIEGFEMPSVVSVDHSLADVVLARGGTVAFERLSAASGADPDQVTVHVKATGQSLEIPRKEAPALSSFYVVPIMFDALVAAFCCVGWSKPHSTHGHDAKVLDMLAHHNAMDLLAATASGQASSSEQVQEMANELWMRIEELGDSVTMDDYYAAFEWLAATIDCEMLVVSPGSRRRPATIEVPGQGTIEFPFSASQLNPGAKSDGVDVFAPAPDSDLARWLEGLDEPRSGFVVNIDRLAGAPRTFIVARAKDKDALTSLDVTLYKRFIQDVHRSERRQSQHAQDTYIARTLQTGMGNNLQQVDGLTARATYNSATETAYVGGDFYDLIRLPDRKACIILGDVAGKGVQSASVSSAVRTSLGAYAWEGLMPAHMVRSLNDFFLGFSSLETFATLFVAIVDLKESVMTYCSAGHPPAMLIHPDQGDIELLNVQSGVVGAFREMIYRDGTVDIHPGDELLLYTDGVTEARSPDGTFFGEIGLHDTVVRSMGEDVESLPEHVLEALYDFTDNHMDDDVAMMAVRFDEVGPVTENASQATEGE